MISLLLDFFLDSWLIFCFYGGVVGAILLSLKCYAIFVQYKETEDVALDEW